MKHVVAVDVGFGFVKVLSTNGLRAIFPASIGTAITRKDLGIGVGSADNEENIEVVINGEGYFVGELSRKMLENAPVFEKDRRNKRTLNLIATAIQLVNPENEPVYLVTGLPLEQFSDDKVGFKEYLDGKKFNVEWITGTHKGKHIFTTIDDSFICPQGAAAIMASLSHADGTLKFPEYMYEGSRIALIDVGFKTTDVMVVEVTANNRSFAPVHTMSFTLDEVGMSKISSRVKEHFKTEFKQDMTSHMLHQALKGLPFAVNGQRTEYKDVLERIQKELAMEVVVKTKEKWRDNESTLSCAFLAGGGAIDLKEHITEQFRTNTFVIEDSQYANAIGYLRAGKPYFARKEKEKAGSI